MRYFFLVAAIPLLAYGTYFIIYQNGNKYHKPGLIFKHHPENRTGYYKIFTNTDSVFATAKQICPPESDPEVISYAIYNCHYHSAGNIEITSNLYTCGLNIRNISYCLGPYNKTFDEVAITNKFLCNFISCEYKNKKLEVFDIILGLGLSLNYTINIE